MYAIVPTVRLLILNKNNKKKQIKYAGAGHNYYQCVFLYNHTGVIPMSVLHKTFVRLTRFFKERVKSLLDLIKTRGTVAP
jgi:hypothetical protein